mgnify:CR=1 FL=1
MNPIRVLCARRAQYLALTFVSAAALTACGGGGGDKDTPAQASSLQRFVINEGNYKDVISTSGAATMQATQPSGTASLVGVQARTGNWMSWVQAVIDQVRATPAVERSLVGVEQSIPCASGSGTVVYTDANKNDKVDGGDVFQADFRACQAQDGSGKYDGKFVMTVQNVTGNTEGHAAKLAFTSLKVEQAEFKGTIDGNMLLVTTSDLVMINAPELKLATSAAGAAVVESWSNFQFSVEAANGGFSAGSKMTFSGALTSSELGNKLVDISTPAALVFEGESESPSTGSILVTGANGSTASVTVTSSTAIVLAVDANGDGKSEQSSTTTWKDFLGGAAPL